MLLDAQAKRRFEREAKSAAKLHHTNIVPVFGVGEQDGMPYYVMQFIQGLGLDEVLEELKKLHSRRRQGRHVHRGDCARRAPGQVAEMPAAEQVGTRLSSLSAANVARSL